MVRWCLNNQTSHRTSHTRLGQLRSRKETHVATKAAAASINHKSIGILLQRAAERCIVDASERIEAGPMSHATLELPEAFTIACRHVIVLPRR